MVIFAGGYSSLLGPPHRRLSCSAHRRKSNSVESSRIFSAYPMGGSFGIDDYFIESDGDEADDEYDQLTNSKGNKSNQYQLSLPPDVSIWMPFNVMSQRINALHLFICSLGSGIETQ